MDTNNYEEVLPTFMALVSENAQLTGEELKKLFKKNRKNTVKLGLLTLVAGIAFFWHEHRMQTAEARIDRLTREVEELLEERTKAKLGEYTESGD